MIQKSSYKFYLDTKKKVSRNVYVYGVLYYVLNFLTISAALLTGILTTWFLAGTVKGFSGENPYRSFLNESNSFVIIITFISAVSSLITGLISFFVINQNFELNKNRLKKIRFEYILYQSDLFYYSGLSKIDKDYTLFKRLEFILNIDRYQREQLYLSEPAK
ncbi:DUF4231 domain-containing protein [Mycoplasmopsis ciconiae]|uniref:DUF4231 domain-containing protein n=1 Tax=Mycoplasmopsis ciconiae TaxID=561067 RepID=A0ABU7MLY6_9BACT|nr:DUF4231 domain-containing protein [Mycoplasmopsis ciconiae]